MGAIYKRELKGYFSSPIGYVILAIFYVFASFFFSILFASGSSDQTQLFSSMFVIVLIVIPLLTMRIFSEDKRQKTDQLLYTAPVSLTGVVIGKYLAAICAAPMVFGAQGVLEGKKATIYPGMEELLKGARPQSDLVVEDGTVITSRGPATAIPFALKLVEILKGKEVSSQLEQDLLWNLR